MPSDDLSRPPQPGATATVIALRGEATADSAGWLEALARRLIDSGASALAIDCSDVRGISGHLVGAVQRAAAVADSRRIPLGVVADGAFGEALQHHTPLLVSAATRAGALAALGCGDDARVVKLVAARPRPRDARAVSNAVAGHYAARRSIAG